MCVLFITFLVRVGKPKPNRTVGYTRCSPQPVRRPSQTENWEGLGSKLHLVREKNAAFVSCCVSASVCTVTECVLASVMALWCVFSSRLARCGREQPHCDRLFKENYQFYLN